MNQLEVLDFPLIFPSFFHNNLLTQFYYFFQEESRPLESEIKREAEVTSQMKQGDRFERENTGNAMMDVAGNGSGGSSDVSFLSFFFREGGGGGWERERKGEGIFTKEH